MVVVSKNVHDDNRSIRAVEIVEWNDDDDDDDVVAKEAGPNILIRRMIGYDG